MLNPDELSAWYAAEVKAEAKRERRRKWLMIAWGLFVGITTSAAVIELVAQHISFH